MQLPKKPKPASSNTPGATTKPSKKRWGASLLQHAASKTVGATVDATSATSTSGSGGNNMRRLQQQQQQEEAYSWDVLLDPSSATPLQRLQRLLVLSAGTMHQQQQQWGIPASQQFQVLLR